MVMIVMIIMIIMIIIRYWHESSWPCLGDSVSVHARPSQRCTVSFAENGWTCPTHADDGLALWIIQGFQGHGLSFFSNQIPCSSMLLYRVKLFGGSSNRGMSKHMSGPPCFTQLPHINGNTYTNTSRCESVSRWQCL